MTKEIDHQKFVVYAYGSEPGSYVAVPRQFSKVIEAAVEQYGSIATVPNMKTVRAVFVKKSGNAFRYVDSSMQESDVTINQLQKPEVGTGI